MKLTLSQQELELAVRKYVTGMISLQEGTDITIDFRAGRGENGITAEIDISYLAVTSIPEIAKPAPLAAVLDAKPAGSRAAQSDVSASPITAAQARANTEAASAAPAEDTPPATTVRKTAGKTLFGGNAAAEPKSAAGGDETPAAANDEAQDPPPPAAAAAGGRKTLFSE